MLLIAIAISLYMISHPCILHAIYSVIPGSLNMLHAEVEKNWECPGDKASVVTQCHDKIVTGQHKQCYNIILF